MRRTLVVPALALACASVSAQQVSLPMKEGSVRFAVIGDSGTGGSAQRKVAERIAAVHKIYPFEFVLMLGDNMYGSEGEGDYRGEVREALQAAPRCRREVLRGARQPRRSDRSASTSRST